MPENTMHGGVDTIFHFVALREPARLTSPIPSVVLPEAGPVAPDLKAQKPAGARTVVSLRDAPKLIQKLDAYLNEREGQPLRADEITAQVLKWASAKPSRGAERGRASAERKLGNVLSDPKLREARKACGDSLVAAAYGSAPSSATRPDLMRVMQLFGFLDFLAAHPDASPEILARVLMETQILLPPGPVAAVDPPEEDAPEEEGEDAAGPAVPAADPLAALRLDAAADEVADLLTRRRGPEEWPHPDDPWVLSARQIQGLSERTRGLLGDRLITGPAPLLQVVDVLRREAVETYEKAALAPLPGAPGPAARKALATELARLAGARPTVGPDGSVAAGGTVLAGPPRIGDLEVVRQKFLCYEKGEIAHVENVMAKERRSRFHQVIDSTETEVTELSETEEDRSWDNQSTTRDELSKETSTENQESGEFSAGADLKAKYGPYVEISANVGYTKNWSSASSERNVRKYAKDVVERAAGKVRSRVLETRRTLTRRQVTEQATHGFDNTGAQAKHVVGIYRWLNKRYEAQVWNLGCRLMLELVVPDPALHFRFASASGAGLSVSAEPPPAFVDPLTNLPLRPSDVSTLTWRSLAARFRAADIDPPPAEFTTLTGAFTAVEPAPKSRISFPKGSVSGFPWAMDGNVPTYFKDNQQIQVPPGYRPVMWSAVVLTGDRIVFSGKDGDWALVLESKPTWGHVAVGPSYQEVRGHSDQIYGFFDPGTGSPPYGFPPFAAGPKGAVLPISLCLVGPPGFTLTVTVVCRRDASEMDRWQMDTWEKLVAQHTAWKRDYSAAVQSAAVGRGVAISGMNPLEYQQVIRTELKRAVLPLLGAGLGKPLVATVPGDPSATGREHEPERLAEATSRVGPEILFWEQGFEWENLNYLFYPYFWTGREDWPQQSRLQDNDPLFAEFLRAGAARVIVPVRPGYELPVSLRLAFDLPEPWLGDPAPVPDKEPWRSVAEEIRSRQRDDTGVPVEAPWPVVLPTTLVMLDAGKDLFTCPQKPEPEPGPEPEPQPEPEAEPGPEPEPDSSPKELT